MPVPHRRKSQGILSIVKSPMMLTKVFDINFMFEKSKTLLLWGFTPAVILSGMLTEPAPASWFELINIWQVYKNLIEIMKTKKKDERRAKERSKNEIRGLGDWQKFPFGFFFSF